MAIFFLTDLSIDISATVPVKVISLIAARFVIVFVVEPTVNESLVLLPVFSIFSVSTLKLIFNSVTEAVEVDSLTSLKELKFKRTANVDSNVSELMISDSMSPVVYSRSQSPPRTSAPVRSSEAATSAPVTSAKS